MGVIVNAPVRKCVCVRACVGAALLPGRCVDHFVPADRTAHTSPVYSDLISPSYSTLATAPGLHLDLLQVSVRYL